MGEAVQNLCLHMRVQAPHIPSNTDRKNTLNHMSHWWHFGTAAFLVVVYALKPDEPDRIVYLFAATFAVIHGAAEKVINYMKSQTAE
jgi:hypothetical protein